MKKLKIILSGGGTGGHIYPAVAVAQELVKQVGPGGVDILFVGALGRMEMEKVPALGYKIEGLPIAGLERKLTPRNLLVPFKMLASMRKARRIIRRFGADAVAGFGGYASAPVIKAAQSLGVPTLIQEQNSYAGLTNKMAAKKADAICVAYQGMERFFDPNKIVYTGNPLRGNFAQKADRAEALKYFGLSGDKPVILLVGGSLGSRTLNETAKKWMDKPGREKVQLIWQTGKYYYPEMECFMEQRDKSGLWMGAFIDRMDLAYAAADAVVSRSGAGSVSELALVGKATVFVPSPNVAEDHQTKNALALACRNAALMVPDAMSGEQAIEKAVLVATDPKLRKEFETNIREMATPEAAATVARKILELASKK